MKTKHVIVTLLFLAAVSSCEKDVTIPVEDNKAILKHKLVYDSHEDSIPRVIHKYHYNDKKQLEKIIYYNGNDSSELNVYESFVYKNNKLIAKCTYVFIDYDYGWIIFDSIRYIYQNERLISEITHYPPDKDTRTSNYFYANSKLIEKRIFWNKQLDWLYQYEYQNGLCVKEVIFSDSLLLNKVGYWNHIYNSSLLTKSEKFTKKDIKYQVITYTYDDNENLIIEHSENIRPDFTIGGLDYFYRYEYY